MIQKWADGYLLSAKEDGLRAITYVFAASGRKPVNTYACETVWK